MHFDAEISSNAVTRLPSRGWDDAKRKRTTLAIMERAELPVKLEAHITKSQNQSQNLS